MRKRYTRKTAAMLPEFIQLLIEAGHVVDEFVYFSIFCSCFCAKIVDFGQERTGQYQTI